MHASLASIGRACTIEEEEPPGTPTQQESLDKPSCSYESYLSFNTCTVRELVEKVLRLSETIKILPYLNRAIPVAEAEKWEPVHTTTTTTAPTSTPSTSSPNPETIQTDVPYPNQLSLNRLTQLHRLCLLTHDLFELDSAGSLLIEPNLGFVGLRIKSEQIVTKEYDALTLLLSSSAFCFPPWHLLRPIQGEDLYGIGNCSIPIYLRNSSSQLGELRVISENLRQCLTQIKRIMGEVENGKQLIQNLASNSGLILFPQMLKRSFLTITTPNKLITLAILNAAQHLIYSGVSLFAHMELTSFSHEDLWEMTRGIEELDILRRQLQKTYLYFHNCALRKLLCNSFDYSMYSYQQYSMFEQLKDFCLYTDSLQVTYPISLGYLFALLARQRSLRLAYLIYFQFIKFDQFCVSSQSESTDTTITDTFRTFISKIRGCFASDYLRNEYEFISGFLDVLSQSTDLLHQVQKLQILCTSAAAAQVRQAEFEQEKYSPRDKPLHHDPNSCQAISVEGKHGIITKQQQVSSRDTDKATPSIDGQSNQDNTRSGSRFSNYQETLHRSSTLDRYVATGSPVCPIKSRCSIKLKPNECEDVWKNYKQSLSNDPSGKKGTQRKKAVQWSDHKEVSTRHQIIGRYLEMAWKYTDNLLNDLFMIPSGSRGESNESGMETNSTSAGFGLVKVGDQWCTSSLCLESSKLKDLAINLRLLAQPEFFPNGLIPIIRRQALRFEELAHRRSWYKVMKTHRPKDVATIDIRHLSVKQPKQYDLILPLRPLSFDPTTLIGERTHQSRFACIDHVLSSQDLKLETNTQDSVADANCDVTKLSDHILHCWSSSYPIVCVDLNTIIQLLSSLIQTIVPDPNTLRETIEQFNQEILLFGLIAIVDRIEQTNQEEEVLPPLKIHSAYEIIRRLNITWTRLTILLRCIEHKCVRLFTGFKWSTQLPISQNDQLNTVTETIMAIQLRIESLAEFVKIACEKTLQIILSCTCLWFGQMESGFDPNCKNLIEHDQSGGTEHVERFKQLTGKLNMDEALLMRLSRLINCLLRMYAIFLDLQEKTKVHISQIQETFAINYLSCVQNAYLNIKKFTPDNHKREYELDRLLNYSIEKLLNPRTHCNQIRSSTIQEGDEIKFETDDRCILHHLVWSGLLESLTDKLCTGHDRDDLDVHEFQNSFIRHFLKHLNISNIPIHGAISSETLRTRLELFMSGQSDNPTKPLPCTFVQTSTIDSTGLAASKSISSNDSCQQKAGSSSSISTEFIQSTITLVSSTMRNTMVRCFSTNPSDSLTTFASEMRANLRKMAMHENTSSKELENTESKPHN